jgi:hypothetical protein
MKIACNGWITLYAPAALSASPRKAFVLEAIAHSLLRHEAARKFHAVNPCPGTFTRTIGDIHGHGSTGTAHVIMKAADLR